MLGVLETSILVLGPYFRSLGLGLKTLTFGLEIAWNSCVRSSCVRSSRVESSAMSGCERCLMIVPLSSDGERYRYSIRPSVTAVYSNRWLQHVRERRGRQKWRSPDKVWMSGMSSRLSTVPRRYALVSTLHVLVGILSVDGGERITRRDDLNDRTPVCFL